MLWDAEEKPEVELLHFNEEEDGIFAIALEWALQREVIKETPEKPFDPDANVTQEEFCCMLYRWNAGRAELDETALAIADEDPILTEAELSWVWCKDIGLFADSEPRVSDYVKIADAKKMLKIYQDLLEDEEQQ